MWLPPEPPPDDLSALPLWRPVADADELAYVVVDELHEGIAGLVVSAWPRVDERGRLRFGEESDSRRVAAPVRALQALLRDRRVDEEVLRDRPVAIGDVFGARLRATPANGDPAAWVDPPVVDLTGPARELTKAQTSAALSGAMPAGYLDVVAAEMIEEPDARH
jgi:hypothetical protein